MIFDFIGGTPAKNSLILRAYDLTNSDKNPWINALSVVNDISGKISSKKGGFESDFEFDENTLIENISSALETSGKYAKDTLEASNVILDYLHTGGEINQSALKATWILPLPNNLVNALAHNYSENESGIDSFLKNINLKGENGNNADNDDKGLKKIMKGLGKGVVSETTHALAKSGENFAKSMKRFNMNIDQKIITTYGDTDIRNFNFEFNLVPFSKKHSDVIFEGILNLKKFMTGNIMENSLSMFIQQPTAFTVEFASRDEGDFNNNLKTKFAELLLLNNNMELNLTSMRSSYLGEKHPIIDGIPKSFTMALTLGERRPYRRDFFKLEGGSD